MIVWCGSKRDRVINLYFFMKCLRQSGRVAAAAILLAIDLLEKNFVYEIVVLLLLRLATYSLRIFCATQLLWNSIFDQIVCVGTDRERK